MATDGPPPRVAMRHSGRAVWNAVSKVSSTLSCTEAPARSTVGIEISLWIAKRWGIRWATRPL
jgi:hypothetical protein